MQSCGAFGVPYSQYHGIDTAFLCAFAKYMHDVIVREVLFPKVAILVRIIATCAVCHFHKKLHVQHNGWSSFRSFKITFFVMEN